MQLDKHIESFLRVMDSKDNSTGGGSASSIAGAMAAGLAGMVARLSMGKEDLESTEHYSAIADQAEILCQKLFSGASQDSEAFAIVSAAFSMPKGTKAEKVARSKAIKDGMISCAEVPLHNATLCSQVLELCSSLEKSYNTATASDLECSRHLARAGLKGCAANVRVNLPYLKDDLLAKNLESRLESILNSCGI